MGFSNDTFLKIKEVKEQKENYTICKCTISKKNKKTNQYELNFCADVTFIGNAHKQRPMAGQRIKITLCDVINCYVKDGKIEFLKAPRYYIFGYELQEEGNVVNIESKQRAAMYVMDDDSPIPF
jgi:hypothetical protein